MSLIIRSQCRNILKLRDLVKCSTTSEFFAPTFSNLKHFINSCRNYHGKDFDRLKQKDGFTGSRYHPTPPLEQAENKVKARLSSACPQTVEEWNELKFDLMDNISFVSELNFSNIVMNCLLHRNQLKEAHSFIDYLKKSNMTPNHLTYLKYMAICGKNVDDCDQNITLETYNKIKHLIEYVPVLDRTRAEHVIQGICGTSQWFLALDYVKKYQEKPTMEMKNSIASAAIRNGNEQLAWEVMTRWFKGEEIPSQRTFKAFLLHTLKLASTDLKRSERFLIQFFEYIQNRYCVLDEDCVRVVEKYFRWNGKCNSCKDNLELTDLTEREFNWLRETFLERSLKKSDVFINTTNREFDTYMKFINANKPFHIVLDGLNVAHTARSKNGFVLARQLYRVINHLYQPSRRILILGKKHMHVWHQNLMRKISQKATFFLTNNISQDDPFLIYAALESGPRSYIVSLDLMRDHMSRLDDPKLISVFKRWQQSHQIYLNVDESNELTFVEPLKYSINIQGNMKDGWHIPFDDKVILDTYEELNNWLCVTKKAR